MFRWNLDLDVVDPSPPCMYVYPDSGKLFVGPPGVFFRLEDAIAAGYWDGESV
jgi:hypothetical protein